MIDHGPIAKTSRLRIRGPSSFSQGPRNLHCLGENMHNSTLTLRCNVDMMEIHWIIWKMLTWWNSSASSWGSGQMLLSSRVCQVNAACPQNTAEFILKCNHTARTSGLPALHVLFDAFAPDMCVVLRQPGCLKLLSGAPSVMLMVRQELSHISFAFWFANLPQTIHETWPTKVRLETWLILTQMAVQDHVPSHGGWHASPLSHSGEVPFYNMWDKRPLPSSCESYVAQPGIQAWAW